MEILPYKCMGIPVLSLQLTLTVALLYTESCSRRFRYVARERWGGGGGGGGGGVGGGGGILVHKLHDLA